MMLKKDFEKLEAKRSRQVAILRNSLIEIRRIANECVTDREYKHVSSVWLNTFITEALTRADITIEEI